MKAPKMRHVVEACRDTPELSTPLRQLHPAAGEMFELHDFNELAESSTSNTARPALALRAAATCEPRGRRR
jgi:hypothetical protein